MKTWIASWKPYFSLYRLKAMQETQYRAAALGGLWHALPEEICLEPGQTLQLPRFAWVVRWYSAY